MARRARGPRKSNTSTPKAAQRNVAPHEGAPHAVDDELEQQLDPILATIGQGGELSEEDSRILEGLLEREGPKEVLQFAVRTASFSGPLPPPGLLAQYDAATRQSIVDMALIEQRHVHDMQKRGLDGMIEKDKRGQRYGVAIALTGLLVAAWISKHSVVAAAVIGTLDLVGMVAIFVAPRILQWRDQQDPAESEPEQPGKGKKK